MDNSAAVKISQLDTTTTEETNTSDSNSNASSPITSSSNSPCTHSNKTDDSNLILVKKCERTNEINVYIDENDKRFSDDNHKNASDLKRLVRRWSSKLTKSKEEASQDEREDKMITSLNDSLEEEVDLKKENETSPKVESVQVEEENNANTATSSLSSMSSISAISSFDNSIKLPPNTNTNNSGEETNIISPVSSSASDSSSSYQLSINTDPVVNNKPPVAITPRTNNSKQKIPVLMTTLNAKKNLFNVYYKDIIKDNQMSSIGASAKIASIAKSSNNSRSGSIDRSSCNTPTHQSTTNLNQSQNSLHKHVCSIANRCTCEKKFLVDKIGEGKYRIGNSKTIVFIRVS
jgi:hypothetical protein